MMMFKKQVVYLIGVEPEQGPTKIGISCDPYGRALQLRVGSPWELRVMAVAYAIYSKEPYFSGEAHALEHEMHIYFANIQIRGEWFNISSLSIMEANIFGLKCWRTHQQLEEIAAL